MILRFEVPGKTVGANATHAGGIARVKTSAARHFFATVAAYGALARKRARLETLEGQVDVLLEFFFDSERPDGDGPVKATLDALQVPTARRLIGAGIIRNDRQVRDFLVRRRIDRERPRVEVTIAPAEELWFEVVTRPGLPGGEA